MLREAVEQVRPVRSQVQHISQLVVCTHLLFDSLTLYDFSSGYFSHFDPNSKAAPTTLTDCSFLQANTLAAAYQYLSICRRALSMDSFRMSWLSVNFSLLSSNLNEDDLCPTAVCHSAACCKYKGCEGCELHEPKNKISDSKA